MPLLRVNSSNDIVVPPFECAWLSDLHLQLEDGRGCIEFEVKGEPFFMRSALLSHIKVNLTHQAFCWTSNMPPVMQVRLTLP